METSKTLKVVGSLVIGLALVCSLLWILAPDSAAQVELRASSEDSHETIQANCEAITTTTALSNIDLGDSNDCTRALDGAGTRGGPADAALGQAVR